MLLNLQQVSIGGTLLPEVTRGTRADGAASAAGSAGRKNMGKSALALKVSAHSSLAQGGYTVLSTARGQGRAILSCVGRRKLEFLSTALSMAGTVTSLQG